MWFRNMVTSCDDIQNIFAIILPSGHNDQLQREICECRVIICGERLEDILQGKTSVG